MSEDSKKTESTEDRIAALEKKVKKTSDGLNGLQRILEKMFGIDLNADGKVGAILLAFLMLSGVTMAADVAKWTGSTSSDSVIIGTNGGITATGPITASGGFVGVVPVASITNAVTTLNLASNAVLTLQRSGVIYDSTGAAVTNAAGLTISPVTNVTITIQRP